MKKTIILIKMTAIKIMGICLMRNMETKLSKMKFMISRLIRWPKYNKNHLTSKNKKQIKKWVRYNRKTY